MPPKRPLGLIAIVLIIDLGLAAAGAVLLAKGLATKDEPKSSASEEKTEPTQKSEAQPASADSVALPSTEPLAVPAAAAAAIPTRDTSTTVARTTTAGVKVASTRDIKVAARKDMSTQASTRDAKRAADSRDDDSRDDDTRDVDTRANETGAREDADDRRAPRLVDKVPALVTGDHQDPYGMPDTAAELQRAFAGSKAAFARCASEHGPARGTIEIAYQVRGDGRVINAAAVDNTTGNTELARCLVAEIASWHVSPHGGTSLTFARPFTYP